MEMWQNVNRCTKTWQSITWDRMKSNHMMMALTGRLRVDLFRLKKLHQRTCHETGEEALSVSSSSSSSSPSSSSSSSSSSSPLSASRQASFWAPTKNSIGCNRQRFLTWLPRQSRGEEHVFTSAILLDMSCVFSMCFSTITRTCIQNNKWDILT